MKVCYTYRTGYIYLRFYVFHCCWRPLDGGRELSRLGYANRVVFVISMNKNFMNNVFIYFWTGKNKATINDKISYYKKVFIKQFRQINMKKVLAKVMFICKRVKLRVGTYIRLKYQTQAANTMSRFSDLLWRLLVTQYLPILICLVTYSTSGGKTRNNARKLVTSNMAFS